MELYVLLNEDNRIVMVTRDLQNDNQFLFNFPSDFDVTSIINYKIIDNELVYDELPIPTPSKEADLSISVNGFDIAKTYVKDDIFAHLGTTYRVIATTIKGVEPPNSFYYEKVDLLDIIKNLNNESEEK